MTDPDNAQHSGAQPPVNENDDVEQYTEDKGTEAFARAREEADKRGKS